MEQNQIAQALVARIEELEQAKRHWTEQVSLAQANLNACKGAEAECHRLLQQIQESEDDEE